MIYYHISEDPNLPTTISPRVPKTAYNYEPKKRRICVSSSILGCIRARYSHSSYRNSKLYLYRVYNTSPVLKPTIKQVNDVPLTNERWILTRSRVELIGEIVKSYGWEPAGYVTGEYRFTKYIGGYDILDYKTGKIKTFTEKIGLIKSLSKADNDLPAK